jgi:hypothetical protein
MAYLQHGNVLGPSTMNCRNAGARMIAADLLAAGVSDETFAQRALLSGFGNSSQQAAPPLIARQPHAERKIGCGKKAGSTEDDAEGPRVCSYSSHHPGLDLRYGSGEIAAVLRELDSMVASCGDLIR